MDRSIGRLRTSAPTEREIEKLRFPKHGVVVAEAGEISLKTTSGKDAVLVKGEGHGEAAGGVDVAVRRDSPIGVGNPVIGGGASGRATPAQDDDAAVQPFGRGGQAVEKPGFLDMKFADIGIPFLFWNIFGFFCGPEKARNEEDGAA